MSTRDDENFYGGTGTVDDLLDVAPVPFDPMAPPEPFVGTDWVNDSVLSESMRMELEAQQARQAAARDYARHSSLDARATARRLTEQEESFRRNRTGLAAAMWEMGAAAPLYGPIVSMTEMMFKDYTAADFGDEIPDRDRPSMSPVEEWAPRHPYRTASERQAIAEAQHTYNYLSRMVPSRYKPIDNLPPEGFMAEPPPGTPESLIPHWSSLSANEPYDAIQRGEIQAGLEAGLNVFRDENTGRIQYFDSTTYRMLDPADLRREFIGGFATDYVVDQTARILRGEPPAPRPRADGYRDVGAVPENFYQPEIYVNYAEMAPSRVREVTAPNYYQGDQWSYFAGAGADEKYAVQERLVANGYLDPEDVTPGVWDYRTAQAMEYLMTDANGNGVTWVEMMNEVERSGGRPKPRSGGVSRSISPFVAPEYIRPDYATMKQAVRAAFASIIGRNLDGNELKILADSMDADYRAEYEARVLAARNEYDRQVAAIRSGARYAAEGGTVQGVSAIDRLNERLLEKYAGEIERNEDVSERAMNVNLIMQSMGVLEGAVR